MRAARGHVSAALFLDDQPITLGETGAVTGWVPLAAAAGGLALPADLPAPPSGWTTADVVRRTAEVLAGPVADDTFRGRAAEAAARCARPVARDAAGAETDRVVLWLRRGFGC